MEGFDASVENTNSIYAPDGGYASGKPSPNSPSLPSVPETIPQAYDESGAYL